jgi:ABC-type transporter Mla maintaining outer membrane lipid asymmetry ATPase subunit MlaF
MMNLPAGLDPITSRKINQLIITLRDLKGRHRSVCDSQDARCIYTGVPVCNQR